MWEAFCWIQLLHLTWPMSKQTFIPRTIEFLYMTNLLGTNIHTGIDQRKHKLKGYLFLQMERMQEWKENNFQSMVSV